MELRGGNGGGAACKVGLRGGRFEKLGDKVEIDKKIRKKEGRLDLEKK